MTKWRLPIRSREYLAQLIIVMLGVFLGILASEWNSDRKLKKHRQDVLLSIRREIELNKEVLQTNLGKMQPFYTAMDSLFRNGLITEDLQAERFQDRPFYERLPNWQGMGADQLSSAMFEAAKFSNVLPGMQIPLLEQLSRTYSKQQFVIEVNATFLNQFLNFDSGLSYGDVLGLIDRIRQELNSSRNLLIIEYDKAIVAIDNSVGNSQ